MLDAEYAFEEAREISENADFVFGHQFVGLHSFSVVFVSFVFAQGPDLAQFCGPITDDGFLAQGQLHKSRPH
jgi:hypothetical protein